MPSTFLSIFNSYLRKTQQGKNDKNKKQETESHEFKFSINELEFRIGMISINC